MGKFEVAAEELRAAADSAQDAGVKAGATSSVMSAADTGHSDLGSAVGAFASHMTSVWGNRLSSTREIEPRLRTTVRLYEDADRSASEAFTKLKQSLE